MASSEHIGRRFWRWFITPPSTATLWKRAAVSLWVTPPIMLFPLLLPLLEPSAIPGVLAEYWQNTHYSSPSLSHWERFAGKERTASHGSD